MPVNVELNKFGNVTNRDKRSTIFYLLKARIGSGIENQEEGFQKIEDPMSKVWTDAAFNSEKLAEKNPKKAVELALTLCLLPRDTENEKIYRWMRGDGPMMLTNKDLKKPLKKYLASEPQGSEFIALMHNFMNHDLTGLTKEEIFNDADCYLAVAAMCFATKSVDLGEKTKELYDEAVKKLADPKVAEAIKTYSESEDTAWIVDELRPFFNINN